jgi:hypothetical protein
MLTAEALSLRRFQQPLIRVWSTPPGPEGTRLRIALDPGNIRPEDKTCLPGMVSLRGLDDYIPPP